MELRITTQMEPGVLPEIQWNHEELKAEVSAKMDEYKSIAYTEEDSKAMRADKATINKFIDAVEEERKKVKRFYLEPYEKFELQIKEVLSPSKEVVNLLDSQLSEVEKKYREEKTAVCRTAYENHMGDLKEIIPFEKTTRDEFYKKAFTAKKIDQAYQDFYARVIEDMEALEELEERFRDKALLEYTKRFSLSDALKEGHRLQELENLMEERRRKYEKSRTKQNVAQTQAVTQEVKPIKETDPGCADAPVSEPLLQLDFRAWGTRVQLMGLREYMVEHNIKFGKVE